MRTSLPIVVVIILALASAACSKTYYVTFTRDQVRISSYQDDAILALVEAWADTVPALA